MSVTELSKSEKLENAFWRAAKWVESTALHYIENCISCGLCYEACPLYHIDPRYAPATVAEWFRRFYRRYCTVIGRLLGKLAHAYPVTLENLLRARDYVYRCTNCGICYLVCAAGIDSGYLATLTKIMIREAGLAPRVLIKLEQMELEGTYRTKKVQELYSSLIDELKKVTGREVPVADPDKTFLIPISVFDLVFGRDAVIGTVKILEKLNYSWTIPREPVGIRPPIAYTTSSWDLAAAKIREVYELARILRTKALLFIDCGYPYEVYRFEGPYIAEIEQPKVLSIVELLEDEFEQGRLFLRRTTDVVTWHDPCMLMRRSGVEPPEKLLDAAALYGRPKRYGKYATCCGAGSHMTFLIPEIIQKLEEVLETPLTQELEKDRTTKQLIETAHKIAERRARELADSGANNIITACYSCIEMLKLAYKKIGLPEIQVKHISTFISERLT